MVRLRLAQHLHFLSYPVARKCQGNVIGGNVQRGMSVPRGHCQFSGVLVWPTGIVDGRSRVLGLHLRWSSASWLSAQSLLHIGRWRKNVWIENKKKQKFVAVATLLKRSQPSLTAIIYAWRLLILEIGRRRSRTFWNNWARINSRNQKQFWQLWSSRVVKNGVIRQVTCDFLFDFQSIYMSISFYFGDIVWQRLCGFGLKKIGFHGNVPWGVEKITSGRLSTAKALSTVQILWRSVW